MILTHAARPGPQHYDWRCLACSEPVAQHAGWFRRWRWRRFARRALRRGADHGLGLLTL